MQEHKLTESYTMFDIFWDNREKFQDFVKINGNLNKLQNVLDSNEYSIFKTEIQFKIDLAIYFNNHRVIIADQLYTIFNESLPYVF